MVALLVQNEYKGASCQHMSQLLAKQKGIHISSKSVSRILKERGIGNPYSHRSCIPRKSRTRTPKGYAGTARRQPFDWLEGRGPKLELHGAVDDATSKVFALYFRREYLEVLERMTADCGLPRAVYTDGHIIFFSPKKDKPTIEELAGKYNKQSAVEPADAKSVFAAPMAKGRTHNHWLNRLLPWSKVYQLVDEKDNILSLSSKAGIQVPRHPEFDPAPNQK